MARIVLDASASIVDQARVTCYFAYFAIGGTTVNAHSQISMLPCHSCRKMPETLSRMEEQMQKIVAINSDMVAKYSHLITKLSNCQAANVGLQP